MFSLAYGIKVESISDPLLVDFESAAGAAISAALPGAFLVVRIPLIPSTASSALARLLMPLIPTTFLVNLLYDHHSCSATLFVIVLCLKRANSLVSKEPVPLPRTPTRLAPWRRLQEVGRFMG
jgi:hypothetical protein